MRFVFRRPFRYVLIVIVVLALAPVPPLLLFSVVNPPTTAFMLRSARLLHAKHPDADIHQRWVSLDHIAACMPLAAVAGEDQTFPDNHGFVWSSIEKAIKHNADGGRVRGASTITQQTAKNLFLWPARSYIRKGIEAYITIWIDILWSKRRVMAVYLNTAQFDDRIFGVGEAARRLFGTSAALLSNAQCAVLAAVLPAPDRYNAAHPDKFLRGRQAWILRQMRQLGSDYLGATLQTN